jgi:hypothetical protein
MPNQRNPSQMAHKGSKILLAGTRAEGPNFPISKLSLVVAGPPGIEPGTAGCLPRGKSFTREVSSGALPLQDPLFRNLAELRARATAEFEVIYIS